MSHLFISYSSVDGQDFAFRLHDALEAPPDQFPAWLDKRDLIDGRPWDIQLRDAIRDCRVLLFAMTPDSVEDSSVCYEEWTLSLSYKKHLVPLLVTPGTEAPFRLHQRQYIDFTTNFDAGLARLRQHLRFLDSPAGELQRMKDQLADARHRHRRARDDSEARRIQDEIDRLTKEDIPRQQKLVNNPKAAAAKTQKSIDAGIKRERQPKRSTHGKTRTKFINPPPVTAPGYFQDREPETGEVGRFLAHDSQRLMIVVGRGGAGKTALVCRLLKALENGHLPDKGGAFVVDGIVYLSALSARRLEFPTLFADLSKLLPDETAQKLETVYENPTATPDAKMRALLAEFTPERFPHGRVVLLLDNFEDVTDPETRAIKDEEMAEALKALLAAPPHPIKVIITTRIPLADLPTVQPGRDRLLKLDEGLESPYAERLLREMDEEGGGVVGLAALAEDSPQLRDARERTRGIPRALEALYGILAADTSTTLDEVLKNIAADQTPETVTEALVGEAYSRLDSMAQRVMGALAIFGRPVSPVAVDTLLQAYIPGIDSAPTLARLVNMHFARKESGRFYLHPLDRAYALSRIPRGTEQDRPLSLSARIAALLSAPKPVSSIGSNGDGQDNSDSRGEGIFSQLALFHRAADYFASTRKPRAEWKALADLQPQLDEFDLRGEGGDWDTAAQVLLEIDFEYLLLWGHFRLMATLHERLGGKLTDLFLRLSSANSLGLAYQYMGYAARAIPHFEIGLQAAHEAENRGSEGAFFGNLGIAYSALGQTARAIEYYELALVISREIGDQRGEGNRLGYLGTAYSDLGQTARAIEYYEQALAISREIGDHRGEGNHLGNLGIAYSDLGQTARAIEYYELALVISREIGDQRGEGNRLGYLGTAYSDLGQTARAIEYYEQALAISREIGDHRGEGAWLGNLGIAYSALGQTAHAIEYYEQALTISREIGDRGGEGNDLGNLASAYRDLGQLENAIEQLRQAVVILREIGNLFLEGHKLSDLGRTFIEAEQYTEAREHLIESVRVLSEVDNPATSSYANGLLALAYLRLNNILKSRAAFRQAVHLADEALSRSAQNYGALYNKAVTLAGLAVCDNNPTYTAQAIDAYRAARAITTAAGIVASELRLFDILAAADTQGVLAGVREAIVGTDSGTGDA